jgi:chromosome segregation ATPase
MTTELNIDHLKEIHDQLTNTIKFLSEEAGKAKDDERITSRQFIQAKDEWGKLETKASELQGLIDGVKLGSILNNDVNSYYSQILKATNSLQEAAKKIEKFGDFLSEIAKVIDIVTSTIKAIKPVGF